MSAYGTDQGFADYCTAMGYTVPSGSVPAARMRGSMYVDNTYESRFPGIPTGGIAQDRAWPRTGAEDIYGSAVSGIPDRVVNASYEAALLELGTPGTLSAIIKTNEMTKRAKAGPVEVEYFDAKGDTIAGAVPMITKIEGLLYPLLTAANLPAVLVV